MCSYHTYTLRTKSLKGVKDKLNITAKFADDLEVMGTLDYLGLGHTSIKKILSYVRVHTNDRITDLNRRMDGLNIYDEIFLIRARVEHLRPSGFVSKIVPISADTNFNNGITNTLQNQFDIYYNRIKSYDN